MTSTVFLSRGRIVSSSADEIGWCAGAGGNGGAVNGCLRSARARSKETRPRPRPCQTPTASTPKRMTLIDGIATFVAFCNTNVPPGSNLQGKPRGKVVTAKAGTCSLGKALADQRYKGNARQLQLGCWNQREVESSDDSDSFCR